LGRIPRGGSKKKKKENWANLEGYTMAMISVEGIRRGGRSPQYWFGSHSINIFWAGKNGLGKD